MTTEHDHLAHSYATNASELFPLSDTLEMPSAPQGRIGLGLGGAVD